MGHDRPIHGSCAIYQPGAFVEDHIYLVGRVDVLGSYVIFYMKFMELFGISKILNQTQPSLGPDVNARRVSFGPNKRHGSPWSSAMDWS